MRAPLLSVFFQKLHKVHSSPWPCLTPRLADSNLQQTSSFRPGRTSWFDISFIQSCDTTYAATEDDVSRLPSHVGMNIRDGRPGFCRVRQTYHRPPRLFCEPYYDISWECRSHLPHLPYSRLFHDRRYPLRDWSNTKSHWKRRTENHVPLRPTDYHPCNGIHIRTGCSSCSTIFSTHLSNVVCTARLYDILLKNRRLSSGSMMTLQQ